MPSSLLDSQLSALETDHDSQIYGQLLFSLHCISAIWLQLQVLHGDTLCLA